jgi:hypothetical protein
MGSIASGMDRMREMAQPKMSVSHSHKGDTFTCLLDRDTVSERSGPPP